MSMRFVVLSLTSILALAPLSACKWKDFFAQEQGGGEQGKKSDEGESQDQDSGTNSGGTSGTGQSGSIPEEVGEVLTDRGSYLPPSGAGLPNFVAPVNGPHNWEFIDGGSSSFGLNHDPVNSTASPPQIGVIGSELWIAWNEGDATLGSTDSYRILNATQRDGAGIPFGWYWSKNRVRSFSPSSDTWAWRDGGGNNGILDQWPGSQTYGTLHAPILHGGRAWIIMPSGGSIISNGGLVRVMAKDLASASNPWTYMDRPGGSPYPEYYYNGSTSLNCSSQLPSQYNNQLQCGIQFLNHNNYSSVGGRASLSSFNNKLYATWSEYDRIRVAVFNESVTVPEWRSVDTSFPGLRWASGATTNVGTTAPAMYSLNGTLYLTWIESVYNSANTGSYYYSTYPTQTYRIRVARYHGDDSAPVWSLIDGNTAQGLNRSASRSAVPYDSPQLAYHQGKLYAVWTESNSLAVPQIRMSVFNGNTSSPAWTAVDEGGEIGFNRNSGRVARSPHILAANSKLYMTWWEPDVASNTGKVRVAVYNDNDNAPDWSFIDGDSDAGLSRFPSRTLNPLPTGYSGYPKLAAIGSALYLAWTECDFMYGACYSPFQLSVARLMGQ